MTISLTVEPEDAAAWLKHLAKFKARHPKAVSLTAPSDGQPRIGDKSDALDGWNVQQAASRLLAQGRSRNSA